MHIIHVQIHVKPDQIEAFKAAILVNAAASLKEPGVARFDVAQDQDDPARFVLVEAYRSAEDHASHGRTAHYAAWAEAVGPMMAEPRTRRKFTSLFPEAARW